MIILKMSGSAVLFILIVTLIRFFFIHKLPKKTFIALWLTAVLLLLVPVSIPSQFSIYSLIKPSEPIKKTVVNKNYIKEDDHKVIGNELFKEIIIKYPTQERPTQPVEQPATNPETKPVIQPVDKPVEQPILDDNQEQVKITLPFSPAEIVWFVGFLSIILYFTINHTRFRKEYGTALPHDNKYIKLWQSQYQLKRKIQIRISDKISTPLTYGVFKPVILLPKTLNIKDKKRLDFILAHEFEHIRNFDTLKKYLLAAAVSIHWFNPFVWVMYYLFNRDIELHCDECVVKKHSDYDKIAYAKALIRLAKTRKYSPLCSNFSKNSIEERIVSIMKIKKTSALAAILAFIIIVTTITVFATTPDTDVSDILSETTEATTSEALVDQSTEPPSEPSTDPSEPSDTLQEPGDIDWPSDLLPAGFPELQRHSIYSVRQENDELIITMFGDLDDKVYYFNTLSNLNWRCGIPEYSVPTLYASMYRKDGWRCIFFEQTYDKDGPKNHLSNIVSPTGYTFEIRVKKVEADPEIFIDRVFPSANTDLGLEEKVFTEWPAEYLPDDFPIPQPGFLKECYILNNIISMEQKSNGVFITLEMNWNAYWRYLELIRKSYVYGNNDTPAYFKENVPFYNKNLDYIFEHAIVQPDSRNDYMVITLQIIRSEHILDDWDTVKYIVP